MKLLCTSLTAGIVEGVCPSRTSVTYGSRSQELNAPCCCRESSRSISSSSTTEAAAGAEGAAAARAAASPWSEDSRQVLKSRLCSIVAPPPKPSLTGAQWSGVSKCQEAAAEQQQQQHHRQHQQPDAQLIPARGILKTKLLVMLACIKG